VLPYSPDAVQRNSNLDLFLMLQTLYRHHHQQVHVAVWSGFTARMRPEEDHPLRMELADDPLHHLFDRSLNGLSGLPHWPKPGLNLILALPAAWHLQQA